MPKLIITVDTEGNVEIDAVGFKGKECLEASKPFEESLGVILERTKKPELSLGKGVSTHAANTKNRNNIRK